VVVLSHLSRARSAFGCSSRREARAIEVENAYRVVELGLRRLRAEAEHPYFFGGSDLAEFWKISWKRVRDGVATSGGDIAEWDRELAELDDPTRLFVGPMTVSVVANKSAEACVDSSHAVQ